MVIFITGKAGAGKTTLAKALNHNLENPYIILDGDAVRELFPIGFTEGERKLHILRMAKIASLLEKQGKDVIIAAIMPKKEWRDEARDLCHDSFLIYVPGGSMWSGGIEYQEPDSSELVLRKGVTAC